MNILVFLKPVYISISCTNSYECIKSISLYSGPLFVIVSTYDIKENSDILSYIWYSNVLSFSHKGN